MASMMIGSTRNMTERWVSQINCGHHEIDVERELVATAGEIIAKASFGMGDENGKKVFDQLRVLQMTLFETNRYVGVPFGKFFNLKKTQEAKKIGKEVDKLLFSIIESRMNSHDKIHHKQDLLDYLLKENKELDGQLEKAFTMRELVDECKTFFFGGFETTSLSITWTLLLLALNEDWQNQLRDEIKEVVGNIEELDINLLADLKKMKWVMNEALRLYPPSPNVQREVKEDIQVDNFKVLKGTNIWIDVVAIHHDMTLWGSDANNFKPQRFMNDANGGCNHTMGYLPFGFGGRTCVGRNLTFMEYKI
uniref:Cytokinin hydroxylase-like n=1 Tax=Cicer arietinum TaxID=3827 RepID=A0A1S2Z8S0_CICAR